METNEQKSNECGNGDDSLNEQEQQIPALPFRITYTENANVISQAEIELIMSVMDQLIARMELTATDDSSVI